MTTINIFSRAEIAIFETPPVLTGEERKRAFRITISVKRMLSRLRTAHSQVGFLLHLGYFRMANRFYSAHHFHERDLGYVMGILNVPPDTDMDRYNRKSFDRHKKSILRILGYRPMGMLRKEFRIQVRNLVEHRTQPRSIIYQMQDWCRLNKVEMCGYSYLSAMITDEINLFEKRVLTLLADTMSPADRELMDNLFNGPLLKELYPFNSFKKIITENRPGKIKASLITFLKIKVPYLKLLHIMEALRLPKDTFRSYGLWLGRARKSQVIRLRDPYIKYLHILSFIHFQFHLWQDAYVSILLEVVRHYQNLARKDLEAYLKGLGKRKLAVDGIRTSGDGTSGDGISDDVGRFWSMTCAIIEDSSIPSEKKLHEIGLLVSRYNKVNNDKNLPYTSDRIKGPDDFLEAYHRVIDNRISGILSVLCFDRANSDDALVSALESYRKDGSIARPEIYTPLFNEGEIASFSQKEGRFRISLCKVLFYGKVTEGIRAGRLNLEHSYKYLAVESYFIDPIDWKADKGRLIEQTGLAGFRDAKGTLTKLHDVLNAQFETVHRNFMTGRNRHLKYVRYGPKKGNGTKVGYRPKVSTPAADRGNLGMARLFEECRYVMLPEILSDVGKATGFTDCFEHPSLKHKKKRPDRKFFFAGLIGYGCNLGPGKMAQVAKGLDSDTLSNTVNWYFSLENILNANDRIVRAIDRMALSDVFRKDPRIMATSSDGQKYGVAVPSLQSTYSLKYFGTKKGVSVYSFINDKYALFYNTVITASEREATYVMDGLLHHDIGFSIDGNAEEGSYGWHHSTDTHGFSETVFGLSHLLDITFAPRLKGYHKQRIYGFDSPSYYREKGYFWSPHRKIDTRIIEQEWDNILRLVASVRMKKAPVSTIFKRLNSYSRQHPLYRALKEFGRIIKTIFLLRYIDDVDIRQQIQYQLNVIELNHLFSRAVFFGRSGEFYEASEEQQKIAAASRMLLQNCIVLWNYMYLSNKVLKSASEEEREYILNVMRSGAMITWQHVHMQGTYNFKEDFTSNFTPSKIAEILDMDLRKIIEEAA